jgi:hypothetical protein
MCTVFLQMPARNSDNFSIRSAKKRRWQDSFVSTMGSWSAVINMFLYEI